MFTPTAEKLIPDLTPREELVVLARALWREGYNDHLAGHITVNLGDGTLLCNPWLLTWAELRPSQVLRIDLEGRVVEGDWPVPLGIPLHLELHKLRARTSGGRCTTIRSSARSGRTWGSCPRSSTRAPRWAEGRWSSWTSTRARSTTPPARGGRSSRWATPSMALLAGHGVFVLGGSARAVHQRAVALEQRCQHAWYARAAGGTGVSRLPQTFIDLVAQSERRGLHRFLGGGGPGRAGGRPRPARRLTRRGPEDLAQLHRHRGVELRVGARIGPPVRAPAHERRGVPEAVLLQVVVGDLARPPRAAAAPRSCPCRRSSGSFPRAPGPSPGRRPSPPTGGPSPRPSGRARARPPARLGGPR